MLDLNPYRIPYVVAQHQTHILWHIRGNTNTTWGHKLREHKVYTILKIVNKCSNTILNLCVILMF